MSEILDRHAEAQAALGLPREAQHFIANEFVAEAPGWSSVIDPTTQATIGSLPQASDAEIEAAVVAARAAQRAWREVAPAKRARALLRIAEKLRESEKRFQNSAPPNHGPSR